MENIQMAGGKIDKVIYETPKFFIEIQGEIFNITKIKRITKEPSNRLCVSLDANNIYFDFGAYRQRDAEYDRLKGVLCGK